MNMINMNETSGGILKPNNIIPFPILKRYIKPENHVKDSDDDFSRSDIDHIAKHFTSHLISHFENQGFIKDTGMVSDSRFLQAVITALLCRSSGKYHEMQDMIDEVVNK